ncbi:hypothetical protein BDR04DRAFT_1127410 [Suillus decipiens]|nr:hypothetical protein BDR04DRAFT_1127410 [Suillus decipiens]
MDALNDMCNEDGILTHEDMDFGMDLEPLPANINEEESIVCAIQDYIDHLQVSVALGHDSPNWRMLNACLPCSYELQDEPPLKFRWIKYFLPWEFINTFSNEVHTHPTPTEPAPVPDDLDNEDLTVLDTVANVNAADCSKNWKAAASDEKKKKWAIFEETGIFVSTCRHGLILWYTDMIRSGELAKYLLAIVAKVLAVIRNCTLGAYDIGCGFSAMVKASSLVLAFMEQKSCLCVDSFHGFAHNYIYFGVMEYILSASNVLVPVIHYASSYHCHWDEEKYMNLGTMLLNNYCQALHIISMDTLALREAMVSLDIQEGNIEQWRSEEIEYFCTVRQEPEWDVHAVAYIDLLQHAQASAGFASFVSTAPNNYQFTAPSNGKSDFYAMQLSQTHKLETQQWYAAEKRDALHCNIVTLEVKLGIMDCWQLSSPEYQETLKYMGVHKYHKVLDNLQHLVVQHLFELQRLNCLQTCCCAIQNAETMHQHLCILHAKEEILRCNVEVCCLQTTIMAKDQMFSCTLASLKASPIHVAVDTFCIHHHHINAHILSHIAQIQALEGFTGDLFNNDEGVSPIINAVEVLQQNEVDDEGPDEDDEENERDIGALVDYISDMALH